MISALMRTRSWHTCNNKLFSKGMSTVPGPDDKQQGSKSSAYLVIAAVLLLTMALLWSVDASLVYITLGAAIFFIFLALWHRPKTSANRHQYTSSGHARKTGDSL